MDFGDEKNASSCIARELVEGEMTLADRLKEIREEGLPAPGYFREVAQLIEEVADALQNAHDTGVTHLNLKPMFILLTRNGRPRVTHFGLARVEDALALSRTGELTGTPCYMSPEQAVRRRIGINQRTDIFSLGVILYEMLTLERPFQGKTSQEVLRNILLNEPRDPRKINPRVPRDLAVICLKAMEKNPDARYGTMQEFDYDLLRYLAGDVIHASPPGFGARLWKMMKRSPAFSTAVVVVLAAVVLILAYILWSYPRIAKEKERVRMEAVVARAAERNASRERDEKEAALLKMKRELRRSDGLRLASLSLRLSDTHPGAALRLAMEAARRSPGTQANNAILESLETCHERRIVYSGFEFVPRDIAFNGDGSKILVATTGPKAFIWDSTIGKKSVVFEGHDREIHTASFSPDNSRVLTASTDGTARIWDGETGLEIVRFAFPNQDVKSAVFSPDGKRVLTASSDGTAKIWDAGSGEELLRIRTRSMQWAIFSPEGKSVLTMHSDCEAFRVWDAVTGNALFRIAVAPSSISSVVFSPDGVELLMSSTDSTACLLVANTGMKRLVLAGHEGALNCARFSPDGRKVVTASNDGTARVWHRATGRLLTLIEGHEDRVSEAVFSPDGSKVLTFSELDDTARLWDGSTGRPLAVFKGHDGAITRAIFSPGGQEVVTASRDRTVRLWSLAPCYTPVRFGSREDGVAIVWPVDPLSVAARNPPRKLMLMEKRKYHVWEEEEAGSLDLLDRLLEEFSVSGDLVTSILNDASLTEEVRSEALEMALEKATLKTLQGDIGK